MTAKHPGDCRNPSDLPARWYRVYIDALKHGQDTAYAHALVCWRTDLRKAAAARLAAGLFGEGGVK